MSAEEFALLLQVEASVAGGGGETMSLVWVWCRTMPMVKELGHGGPHVCQFSLVLWLF